MRHFFNRQYRTQTIIDVGHRHTAGRHALHCHLSDCGAINWRRRVALGEKSRDWRNRLHIFHWCWLGNGMEFYPVSYQRGGLPIACSSPRV